MANPKASGETNAIDRASTDLLRRVPPHSIEAEKAVLAGILIHKDVFHTIADILASSDFYLPAHQTLYTCLLDLYRQNAPIDIVSTATWLNDHEKLEAIGGSAYLADLSQSVVDGANAEYFAGIVRDKSLQRSLIGVCSEIIGNCFDQTRPVDTLLDESEQAVFAISERTSGKTFKTSKQLVSEIFSGLTHRSERTDMVTGVATGYTRLDQLTMGFQPSDLIIIAARPSMGKTALALNMATHAAVVEHVPVAIYSLEMSTDQLMMRMLCAEAHVDLSHVRRGYLETEEWNRLYDAADKLSQAPIYIDDTPSLSPLELRARTRRLKAESDVGLVMIDYLQLMRGARRTDSREQEISEISRSLKSLAKELNIPVVALSQLNRKLEERTDKRPQLSDLRESGAIEQDADVIMFIYRDEIYHKSPDNPHKGTAEIIIGKQRNGPIGTAVLAYLNSYTAFVENEALVDSPSSETGEQFS